MIKIALACSILGLTLLTAPPINAASTPKPGDCYDRVDSANTVAIISTKVDCSQPHAIQVAHVAKLPASVKKRSKAALTAQSGKAWDAFITAARRECSPKNVIQGIWPKTGQKVLSALGPNVWLVEPGSAFFPQYSAVVPDQAAWDRGVRVLLCVAYVEQTMTEGVRALETNRPLPNTRLCTLPSNTFSYFRVCSRPHESELLFDWSVSDFPPGQGSEPSAAVLAPYLARCQAAADALIGAKRTDVRASVRLKSSQEQVATLHCAVTKADGSELPTGTVVGLGKKPLGA